MKINTIHLIILLFNCLLACVGTQKNAISNCQDIKVIKKFSEDYWGRRKLYSVEKDTIIVEESDSTFKVVMSPKEKNVRGGGGMMIISKKDCKILQIVNWQ